MNRVKAQGESYCLECKREYHRRWKKEHRDYVIKEKRRFVKKHHARLKPYWKIKKRESRERRRKLEQDNALRLEHRGKE